MADRAERLTGPEAGQYDPRRDANWQARLEEARAKREIALRNKPAKRPAKRLKPWEEEGAAALDDDADFSPAASGLEFSDRVDAIREHRAPQETPLADAARPGSNWSPDVEQSILTPVPEPAPVAPTPDRAESARRPVERAGSVNDIFSDPAFREPYKAPAPAPKSDEDETIPIAQLRAPLPKSEPPRRAYRFVPDPEPEPERQVVAASPAKAGKKDKPRRSNLWVVVALFGAAIAIGPVYKMSQPVERGPLVFTLSSFPIEPAFGLTSPMFEQPTPTRSREWKPASLAPTDEPLALAKPNVPERARVLANFTVVPAFGADASGILMGRRIESLPDTPVLTGLPVMLPERPLGAFGESVDGARDLGALQAPAPRPGSLTRG